MPHILSCPSCTLPLQREGKSFVCEKKHTFDISADGYLNLLLANQKHSLEPGDAKEMLQARREFLRKGFYKMLADHIDTLCREALGPVKSPVILDLGCGEGYYTESVKAAVPGADVYGLDISKAAAKMAARKSDAVSYIVASMKHLPFAKQSVDIILNIFAPSDLKECSRVLRSKGRMIIVRPGPKHLREFTTALGMKETHGLPAFALDGIELNVAHAEHVRGSMKLETPEDIRNLCHMTPLYWRSSSAAQEALVQRKTLETEFDFHVSVITR